MKIKKRYAQIVSRVGISVAMSLSISFFMTIINKTPIDRFLISWLSSSFLGSMVGIPLASIYVPTILKAVENMEEDDDEEDINEEKS